MSKNTYKRHTFKILSEEGKRHYVLTKDCNTFIYDHTLHCGEKHFSRYFLQDFGIVEILKGHVNDCFKINGKQMIKMLEKGEYVRFKKYERKIKSQFMIYVDFESVLVPEDNENQNPDDYPLLCMVKQWKY